MHAYAVPKVAWIRSKLGLDGCSLLEVGAGSGYMTHELMRYCDVTALDISKTQLRYNPVDRKVVGSAYELPFDNTSFDVVFCANLLHHLNEPLRAIAEMERVSKRFVVASEPNRKNPYTALAAAIPLLLPKDEWNIRNFTRSYLIRMLESGTMRVIHHIYQGGMVSPKVNPRFLLRISMPNSTSSLSSSMCCRSYPLSNSPPIRSS
ncbi:MAG: class I SAM-dependent methyltransferase [Armatimonadetes bacterium]|nr:class I SAM-dependent methyltransferase [Armatimonadota bacterium]